MDKKKTAVEWLAEELLAQFYLQIDSLMAHELKGKIQQAKEMEKQQIIDACNQIEVIGLDHELPGEQYYNKTFNK